jgi:hypothetical protein
MTPSLRSDASETLTDRLLPHQIAHMIRPTTDRIRRVCAILIGMSVLAVSVCTVMIHDGMH